MSNIIFHNNKQSLVLTLVVTLLLLSISVVPLIFYFYFYHTFIFRDFINNSYFIYVISFLFFYFIYYGIYNYKIKFEHSTFRIESRRTLSSWFGSKAYDLEISNDMLIGFRFIKTYLNLNDMILIQMQSSSGRKSAVRIPVTFLNKRDKRKITQIYNRIIQNNRCQKS